MRAVDFTEEVGGMWEWFIGELGLRKAVKMMFGLLLRPSLLRAMMEYAKLFEEYGDYMGYAYFVGVKPPKPSSSHVAIQAVGSSAAPHSEGRLSHAQPASRRSGNTLRTPRHGPAAGSSSPVALELLCGSLT